MPVVAIDLHSEHLLSLIDYPDSFHGTGSDNPVLKPPVRAFDLPLGLRREGMRHLRARCLNTSFPLRVNLICLLVLFDPDAIPMRDEPEYPQAIHIVLERNSTGHHELSNCLNMGPC